MTHRIIVSPGGQVRSEADLILFVQAQAGCRDSLKRLMAQHEGLVQAVVRRQWLGPLAYGEVLPDPVEPWLQAEVQAALYAVLARLPRRLQRVIVAYYGLQDQPPASLRQLGRVWGLSHESVRQQLLTALVWLRHPAHSLTLRQLLERNTSTDYEQADVVAEDAMDSKLPAAQERAQDAAFLATFSLPTIQPGPHSALAQAALSLSVSLPGMAGPPRTYGVGATHSI